MTEISSQSKEINPAHDKRIAVSVTSHYCMQITLEISFRIVCFFVSNVRAIRNLSCHSLKHSLNFIGQRRDTRYIIFYNDQLYFSLRALFSVCTRKNPVWRVQYVVMSLTNVIFNI